MKASKDLTPFGVFMRELRYRECESTEVMADNLGVSRSFLVQLELGISPIPLHMIEAIYNNYYLSERERMKLYKFVMDTNKDPQVLTLSHLNDKNKFKILRYAYALMLGLGVED